MFSKNGFNGYFGCAVDNLYGEQSQDFSKEKIQTLFEKLLNHSSGLRGLMFPRQTHSSDVIDVNESVATNGLMFFDKEADAIITQQKNLAIGVVTADCVPLIIYDPKSQSVGVVHAGWRGLSSRIITETIKNMIQTYDVVPKDLNVFVGPAACQCCYEVSFDFKKHFESHKNHNNYFNVKNGQLYFDAKAAVSNELVENGVLMQQIDFSHHDCTICSDQYCSYRRQKNHAGRQPTVAFLTE